MKYFVILLVLIGAMGTAYAESQVMLTPFDVYLSDDDFTAQGPNHNILALDRGESVTLTVYVKNNDDKPHQVTLKDPRGPDLRLFETFRFEPEQIMVMPHQTNSTRLYLTISKDTNTHSSFVTFLGQSATFGMRGLGFFVVVDREIDDYVDKSLRSGLPGGAFSHLNTEISKTDAEKLIGSGFGIPEYLPSGYEFRGMDGSEDQQRFVYSPASIDTETTGFSEFWNDGGLLILYNIDGPNVNNTKSLPIRVAQDEGQQIMINGMMGDATEKQTRVVAESDITYDFPASVTFFDDAKKRSAHLRANVPLDELLKIASSIPIYDEQNSPVVENMSNQNHSIILPFDAKEKTLDEFMEWCKPHYEEKKCEELYPKNPIMDLLSPLKQMQSGISFEEVQCRENLVLIQKHDETPACVKPETISKLIERGWTTQLIVQNIVMKTMNKKLGPECSQNTMDEIMNGKVDERCAKFLDEFFIKRQSEMMQQGYTFDQESKSWTKEGYPDMLMSIVDYYQQNLKNSKTIHESEPLDIANIEDRYIHLNPADMCATISLELMSPDKLGQTKSGTKYVVFLELDEKDIEEMPILDELIRATHYLEFSTNDYSHAEMGLRELVDYELFIMEKAIEKYGDTQDDYFMKLDSDLDERLADPKKQGFSNEFIAPQIVYENKVYVLSHTVFWVSDEHETQSMSVHLKENLDEEKKVINLNDKDMESIPKVRDAIKRIGTELESVVAFKGVPENPDWNNYREWYAKKSAEQFDTDNVYVRGFVYENEHYDLGFPIC